MSLSDLETVGYTVVPNFLSASELLVFKNEFLRANLSENKNYAMRQSYIAVDLLGDRIMKLSKEVEEVTSLKIDMLVRTVNYTDTGSVKFGWHQDHESQYVYQQSFNHLNFYIPIVKPNPSKSGLGVIPMDALKNKIGDTVNNFIGSGAKKFFVHPNGTKVQDDETGEVYNIPVNLNEIAHIPELNPGDLLLVRGDVIHKTQDSDTRRIAISVRAIENSIINKDKLFSGCAEKMKYINNSKYYYDTISKIFEDNNTQNIRASDIKINRI